MAIAARGRDRVSRFLMRTHNEALPERVLQQRLVGIRKHDIFEMDVGSSGSSNKLCCGSRGCVSPSRTYGHDRNASLHFLQWPWVLFLNDATTTLPHIQDINTNFHFECVLHLHSWRHANRQPQTLRKTDHTQRRLHPLLATAFHVCMLAGRAQLFLKCIAH